MKPHTAFLAGALLLSACNPSAEQAAAPTNSERMTALYDAFAAGDVEKVVAQMDPEIVWNEAENFIYADGNPYMGADAVVEGVFGRIGAEFDNFRLEETHFYGLDDDGVLVTGRYRGTFKATGKQLDAQFAHVWKLKDTLVASFQQYTDTWQAKEVTTPSGEMAEAEEE